MYFCSDFMEISHVAHFWKAYGTRNAKIYVYICVDARMTAILDFQNGRLKIQISRYLSF